MNSATPGFFNTAARAGSPGCPSPAACASAGTFAFEAAAAPFLDGHMGAFAVEGHLEMCREQVVTGSKGR